MASVISVETSVPSHSRTVRFINYDNSAKKPQRRKASAHPPGYHKWKLHEAGLQVKASSLVSIGPTYRLWDDGNNEEEPSFEHIESTTDITPCSEVVGLPLQRTGAQPSSRAIHPLTILQRGNSDPFSSYAIPINPQANNILGFYREYILPAIHILEIKSVHASAGMRDWGDAASNLHDKCTAYSFLARSAVLMSPAAPTPDLAMRALAYRNRSSELLRERLDNKRREAEPQTHRSIFAMLVTELFAENLNEAAIHARMLNILLVKQSQQQRLDLRFLFKAFYYDYQRASMSLSRPAFDLDWVCEQFHPAWQAAKAYLPQLSGRASTLLDQGVSNEKLRLIFIAIREIYETFSKIVANPETATALSWAWLSQNKILAQNLLLNHYLDVLPVRKSKELSLDDGNVDQLQQSWQAYTQAYTCLAALYTGRRISKHENVPICPSENGGAPVAAIFNAGAKILPALREALELSAKHSLGLDASVNGRLRLWALYVGASSEQVLLLQQPANKKAAEDQWFSNSFAAQAMSLGFYSWAQVRQVLTGFIYTDTVQPNGSLWFPEMVSAYLEN